MNDDYSVPVAPDAIDQAPSFLVSVADYNPVWFHCQQPNPAPGHCAMGKIDSSLNALSKKLTSFGRNGVRHQPAR